jgi:hypothetical protein
MRFRGYAIDSEDDVHSTSADEDGREESESKPLMPCFADEPDADHIHQDRQYFLYARQIYYEKSEKRVVCTVHPSFAYSRTCPNLDFAPFILVFQGLSPNTITSEAKHELQAKESREEKQGKDQGEKGSENEDGDVVNFSGRPHPKYLLLQITPCRQPFTGTRFIHRPLKAVPVSTGTSDLSPICSVIARKIEFNSVARPEAFAVPTANLKNNIQPHQTLSDISC